MPVPYRFEFDFGSSGKFQFFAPMFAKSPVQSYQIDRTMFVSKSVDLEFVDGVPTKLHLDRPSPAMEVVSLPLDLATAILSAPAEIFRLRLDYSSALENERRGRKSALEADQELREFLEDYISSAQELQPD